MAAPIYWGPRAKFLKWILFKHDFELYPFDRELFSDIGYIVVRLIGIGIDPFGAAAQKEKIVAKALDGQRYPCPA